MTPRPSSSKFRPMKASKLIGQDPIKITQLETRLDRLVNGYATARGAINMALYDIRGKVLNIPVYELLGGLHHEKLPLLLGIGSLGLEDSLAAINELRNQGVTTVMLKMGEKPIGDENTNDELEKSEDKVIKKI